MTDCSKWGLFTRPLTQNWGRGRIQLIGDAAHAMLPNAGQGACQAFEDAYILARWLGGLQRPGGSLCQFPPRTHPACARRAAIVVLECTLQAHARRTAQKESIAAGKGSVHGSADWVWGYDPVPNGTKSRPFRPLMPLEIERAVANQLSK